MNPSNTINATGVPAVFHNDREKIFFPTSEYEARLDFVRTKPDMPADFTYDYYQHPVYTGIIGLPVDRNSGKYLIVSNEIAKQMILLKEPWSGPILALDTSPMCVVEGIYRASTRWNVYKGTDKSNQ